MRVLACLCLGVAIATSVAASAPIAHTYEVDPSTRRQTILGLGFEIQSDSIGSGNNGLPESNASVPWDLTPSEKVRFFSEMLAGFRYCRLALGLYFRGLSSNESQIQERWPGQAAGLAVMAQQSGIEGFDAEYWSPAPFWKNTSNFINGSLASFEPQFLATFGEAVVQDLQYLEANGMHVVQFGLQNEPPVGPDGCTYSCCGYNHTQYYQTFAVVAPKVRAAFPNVTIHVNSWGGQQDAALIASDPATAAYVDGWTWHMVGADSDDQINEVAWLTNGTLGKPVWNNEFEYLDDIINNYTFVNTAQSIMNWFVFENSPTWFWLHALKPTTNSESVGYGLGYWRPWNDTDFNASHFPNLAPGHWEYNPANWNSVAGFVRYLPWDSVRVDVRETVTVPDARILAYVFEDAKARWRPGNSASDTADKLGIVVTNRYSDTVFVYNTTLLHVDVGTCFNGFQYEWNATDVSIGTQLTVVGSGKCVLLATCCAALRHSILGAVLGLRHCSALSSSS